MRKIYDIGRKLWLIIPALAIVGIFAVKDNLLREQEPQRSIIKTSQSRFSEKTVQTEGSVQTTRNSLHFPVYVTGAVKRPGVYHFSEGELVNDALRKADGFSTEANTEAVNLARILQANEKIYIPRKDEPYTNVEITSTVAGKIDINTADVKQLQSLPGIGAVSAGHIVRFREENGHFETIEGLMKIPGIKEAKFQAIKDLICVKAK